MGFNDRYMLLFCSCGRHNTNEDTKEMFPSSTVSQAISVWVKTSSEQKRKFPSSLKALASIARGHHNKPHTSHAGDRRSVIAFFNINTTTCDVEMQR